MAGVVLLEEQSARTAVEILADRMGLLNEIQLVSFEGKSDLERSFVRKIVGWRYPADAKFLVARDNDGADCHTLKARLIGHVPANLRHRVKVRLVMQELESWYLGDFGALTAAGMIDAADAARLEGRVRFRDPDRLTNASSLFQEHCRFRGKIGSARAIAPHLDLEGNRSASFRHFLQSLRWVSEGPN